MIGLKKRALLKRSLADDLLPLTPEWGMKYLPEVVAGSPEAAAGLIFAADNNQRGKIVAALVKHDAPPEVLRVALEESFIHDHGHVRRALGDKRLVAAFRAAQFPTDHLPAELTIWRGVSGELPCLFDGASWTRDRDRACWFAMRFAEFFPPPRVVKATIKREQVLAHLTGRNEDEIVVEPWSVTGEIDGNIEDWQEAAHRVNLRRDF